MKLKPSNCMLQLVNKLTGHNVLDLGPRELSRFYRRTLETLTPRSGKNITYLTSCESEEVGRSRVKWVALCSVLCKKKIMLCMINRNNCPGCMEIELLTIDPSPFADSSVLDHSEAIILGVNRNHIPVLGINISSDQNSKLTIGFTVPEVEFSIEICSFDCARLREHK